MLFDTHCHLMDTQFDEDLETVIARAREGGVHRIVIPAIDVATAHRAISIAEKHDGIYAAVGIHPEAAKDQPDAAFAEIESLAIHPKVVAIGEIGLDYYWDAAPRPEQQEVMARQIEIAKRTHLPIIIHNRDATADTVAVLRQTNARTVGGVMHCFTGSLETARECMEMGFYISFGGPVTFKNAKNVQAVAAEIPLEWLLVETDSPYLAPHPHRGKRNEPMHVRLVAEKMALLQSRSVESIVAATTENALRLFKKISDWDNGAQQAGIL